MSLTLLPRVDFDGKPFPSAVAEFSLAWLKSSFYPAQLARWERIEKAVKSGEDRIAKVRATVASDIPVIGERRANGLLVRTPEDQRLQKAAHDVAEHQVILKIRAIRKEVDAACDADLQEMKRASNTAQVLSERVFSKIACLSRETAGMRSADANAFKSAFAVLIRGIAPIELHRLAQAAIDDGSPLALARLDVIRVENFGRKKEDRAFNNQTLLDLANVPEFNEATGTEENPGILRQVVDLQKRAGIAWAGFLGSIGQVGRLRIERGLATAQLNPDVLPIHKG